MTAPGPRRRGPAPAQPGVSALLPGRRFINIHCFHLEDVAMETRYARIGDETYRRMTMFRGKITREGLAYEAFY